MQFCDLTGKKIMITGASSGIGRETAILASQLGASLVLCGRDKNKLEETFELLANKDIHKICQFDVLEFERYNSIFDEIVSDGKKLSGMVHCAGVMNIVPIRAMNYKKINEILDTNFTSYLLLVSAFAKSKYSINGSIVGISSTNAHYYQKCMSIYSASKAAIETATGSMAIELAEKNTRINCVVPGAIKTGMSEKAMNIDKILDKQLLGIGSTRDVANMISYLLSDEALFVTGRSYFVDGGLLGQ